MHYVIHVFNYKVYSTMLVDGQLLSKKDAYQVILPTSDIITVLLYYDYH